MTCGNLWPYLIIRMIMITERRIFTGFQCWTHKAFVKWVPMSAVYFNRYSDVKMGAMASQITGLTIFYSAVYSGADQRKHQTSTSLAFVRGIHRWPVTSPHKWPAMRKIFPFDDVIMVQRWSNGDPRSVAISPEPLLPTWTNIIPCIDKLLHPF